MKLTLICLATAILVTESAQAGDLLDFPIPDSPVVIPANSDLADADEFTIEDLIALYSKVTGQHCVMSAETQAYASNTPATALTGEDMTIAPERFQETFEAFLMVSNFVFTPLTADEPRLFTVNSLYTGARSTIKSLAMYLPPDRLDEAAAHPAILFTTVVNVPHTDVRQVTTSLRSMFPDPNTQQMLPVGNTHAIVLMGLGPNVVSFAQLLKVADEAEGRAHEERMRAHEESKADESAETSQACDVSEAKGVRVAGA
ncbi:MAG TPA: hypothetical protein EYQ74_06580 [Planctomycetes bacterium]|nr:hypothetical protein [Planctomycetota bacterium]